MADDRRLSDVLEGEARVRSDIRRACRRVSSVWRAVKRCSAQPASGVGAALPTSSSVRQGCLQVISQSPVDL